MKVPPVAIITDPHPDIYLPGMARIATVMSVEDHALVAGQIESSPKFKEDIATGRRLYLQPLTKAQVDICLN